MYSFTIFKSQFDNKTDKRMQVDTWDDFEGLLIEMSKRPGEKGGKNSSPLISPAWFTEGTTRSNKNVEYWGKWAAIDVDDHELKAEGLEDELLVLFGRWDYCCYSTASSTFAKPKFRIVFPLKRNIQNDEIKRFWFALQSTVQSLGDRQCKDLSRMYYVPAKYPCDFNFLYSNRVGDNGNHIDPDELMRQHPYLEKTGNSFLDSLSEEMQKEIIEHRRKQMNNTNIHWNTYSDCPFFPKKLAKEYKTITSTGWYHAMYCIMVSIASNAIKKKYPITGDQIAEMCRQFDMETGNWYEKRPLILEANSALNYAYRNASI